MILTGGTEIKQRFTPVLMFVGKVCCKAEEAINFYTSVFRNAPNSAAAGETKATVLGRYGKGEVPDTEGAVRYAQFLLRGQEFGATDSAHPDSERSAQAGLYLFTTTHYSMVLAGTGQPDIADTSKATADELRAIWGPLLANAGTYEISGDLSAIHPLVAKIPVVMKPGANEVYHFRIEGKTLTLRQVRNARGVAVDSEPTFKFVRVE